MSLIVALLLPLAILIAFARALYLELRRTSWSLLESLIAANILGHAVALPVAWAWKDSQGSPSSECAMAVAGWGTVGLLLAIFMAAGAIWVFRRLKAKGESRTGVRIVYMLLGLFLFPSMVLIPFNFVFGWIIWLPLWGLHLQTERLLKPPLPPRAFPRTPAQVTPAEVSWFAHSSQRKAQSKDEG
jgi:fatty acid desaturase